MSKLKIFESFSGIGAVSKSIKRLNVPYELVGFSEIDKFAVKSFCAINNVDEKLNYGDICLIDENNLPEFDLYTFGSPCQDFSVAGRQEGAKWKCSDCGKEYNPLEIHYSVRKKCPICNSTNIVKTRSSLVVESLRIINKKKPKYLLMENVKNLVGKQFKSSFDKIIEELKEYGYNTYWDILNSKDYGIPQSRERVFVICIRKDVDKEGYSFPFKIKSDFTLVDFLEKDVDSKYYLPKSKCEYIKKNLPIKYDKNKLSMLTKDNKIIITGVYNQKDGFKEQDIACTLDASYYKGIGNNQNRIAVCEISMGSNESIEELNYRLRKLTPKECFRIMGFTDNDFELAVEVGISSTQLYKQAGNSIVVNTLECILKELF